MRRILGLALLVLVVPAAAWGGQEPAASIAVPIENVRAAVVGPGGKVYAATKDAVCVVEKGKACPFASGVSEPVAMAAFGDALFVAGRARIWRIDRTGKTEVFADTKAFPTPPQALSGLAVGELGLLYATDAGTEAHPGAIYRIDTTGKVSLVSDASRAPLLRSPRGAVLDGASYLLTVESSTGTLLRVKVADGKAIPVTQGLGSGGSLAWDWHGRLYIGDSRSGRVFVLPRPGHRPVLRQEGFQLPSSLALGPTGKYLLVADSKAGTLTQVPAAVPGKPVDERPLPLEAAVAFPDLQWTGWKEENEKGLPTPLRPLVLTHAGDGSNRIFVATEHGVIHVFPNDPKAARTRVFLDLQDRVSYVDEQNEEGFLGLAFHPRYKENGEFFVFYTLRQPKLTNVLSRFRVSRDDPDRADPASEEVLLKVSRPYWNHDGGTLCFGPDGYLYVVLGDGGAADDPYNHGQDVSQLLGKVLRLDVDHRKGDRPYAIPRDNPFVGRPRCRPEIWAYGLRNPWRMAFDRATGKLWAADVGQNLYEEINLIERGGNYGWSDREGLHPFGANGPGPRHDVIEPIWEYHHDVGKSITGGLVYRGKELPELEGAYLYADYVSARIWALRYDDKEKRVVSNRPIRDPGVPILSFGEDEKGEAYFMTYSPSGKGLYRFVSLKREKKANP